MIYNQITIDFMDKKLKFKVKNMIIKIYFKIKR
jgi:hypothetical protein